MVRSMNRKEFELLVEDELDRLPEAFAGRLANVQIVIEDAPAPALLRSLGLAPGRESLFGLYDGVPLSERGFNDGGLLPDRIVLFYKPLVRAFRTPRRIRRQIRFTLIHEIAHFLGMDEDEIDELGYG
jgi:predicted Zn-dependent protease with MMP-like domain